MDGNRKIIVALDAMGGDNAPDAVVEGAKQAVAEWKDCSIRLYGPETLLREKLGGTVEGIEICDAQDVITMEDAPMLAVRRKTESGMVKAAMAVRDGTADAFLSAGSTGAILACGMLRVGRIPGIERPALAVVYPGAEKPFLILDSGANVDCQPKWLEQFGLMGAAYMRALFGIEKPDVRLLNNGTEETKGSRAVQEAHRLMKEQTAYPFGGNIEAREVPYGRADVVVCDGFDGNVVIKLTEGITSAMFGMMKDAMMATTRGKIGGALVKPSLKAFKSKMDYEQYGGAPLLGVNGVMIKAHGSSNATAIKNAVHQAVLMARGDVSGAIIRGMNELSSTRPEG